MVMDVLILPYTKNVLIKVDIWFDKQSGYQLNLD